MSIFEPVRFSWTNRMLSVLRIVTGWIFLMAGTMKLFGFPPPPAGAAAMSGVFPWEIHLAGLIETFGGAAMLIGLFTRPVAILLAGEMAVAYFQVHFRASVFPITNGGMPAVFACFISLYLGFAGAGAWSIDAIIARAHHPLRQRIFNAPVHARMSVH